MDWSLLAAADVLTMVPGAVVIWFQKPELKAAFKAKFGYDVGVPVDWSAYEDIADFFTNTVKEIDGQKVYGHMDYGKRDPSLGWRFTDAWLSMAGNGDSGLPNGRPVDEWGIRAENGIPVGSSISRGGDANGLAAVYALTKFVEWRKKYAPPEAAGMDFLDAGAVPGQGHTSPSRSSGTAGLLPRFPSPIFR
jgi:glycerol transport system substrate-binding protein